MWKQTAAATDTCVPLTAHYAKGKFIFQTEAAELAEGQGLPKESKHFEVNVLIPCRLRPLKEQYNMFVYHMSFKGISAHCRSPSNDLHKYAIQSTKNVRCSRKVPYRIDGDNHFSKPECRALK